MGRRRLGVDRVRGDVLHDLLALCLQHLATLLGRQLNLAALDDLLGDPEGLRGPEELHHLLLGRLEPLCASLKISSMASSRRRSTSLPSRIRWTASGFTRTSNFSPAFSMRAITYSLKISSRRSDRSSLGMTSLA